MSSSVALCEDCGEANAPRLALDVVIEGSVTQDRNLGRRGCSIRGEESLRPISNISYDASFLSTWVFREKFPVPSFPSTLEYNNKGCKGGIPCRLSTPVLALLFIIGKAWARRPVPDEMAWICGLRCMDRHTSTLGMHAPESAGPASPMQLCGVRRSTGEHDICVRPIVTTAHVFKCQHAGRGAAFLGSGIAVHVTIVPPRTFVTRPWEGQFTCPANKSYFSCKRDARRGMGSNDLNSFGLTTPQILIVGAVHFPCASSTIERPNAC